MAPGTGLIGGGSIALDTLEGGFGRVENELGGSALYFCLAASLLTPVAMLAVAGTDVTESLHKAVEGRPIELGLLSILDAPSYRWRARQGAEGHNVFLGSDESIYDLWHPRLPEGAGWVFLGSMRTALQLQIARALRTRAELVAADSMSSYAVLAPREAQDLVTCCDWFFCNEEELEAMGGDPMDPEGFQRLKALRGLCLKSGPRGATVVVEGRRIQLPALPGPVVDTTGAGDALAGGLMARWQQLGGSISALPEALAYGIACASITIGAVGARGLLAATIEDVRRRVEELMARLGG